MKRIWRLPRSLHDLVAKRSEVAQFRRRRDEQQGVYYTAVIRVTKTREARVMND